MALPSFGTLVVSPARALCRKTLVVRDTAFACRGVVVAVLVAAVGWAVVLVVVVVVVLVVDVVVLVGGGDQLLGLREKDPRPR